VLVRGRGRGRKEGERKRGRRRRKKGGEGGRRKEALAIDTLRSSTASSRPGAWTEGEEEGGRKGRRKEEGGRRKKEGRRRVPALAIDTLCCSMASSKAWCSCFILSNSSIQQIPEKKLQIGKNLIKFLGKKILASRPPLPASLSYLSPIPPPRQKLQKFLKRSTELRIISERSKKKPKHPPPRRNLRFPPGKKKYLGPPKPMHPPLKRNLRFRDLGVALR
jgi:hypothetical protein